MAQQDGKVAWVTGAGSGIGEAAARALAASGVTVVLSGRRPEALQLVADAIAAAGGIAHVQVADVTDSDAVQRVAAWTRDTLGRIDILVNNAGSNIQARSFAALTPAGVDQVIGANLSAAFYCVTAVLPIMRAQGDGVLIHTGSWAGRHPSPVSGAAYSAAKQGMMVMSQLLNEEECVNGIRSCVICPAETATPILDKRPVKVSDESRARMLQPDDLGDLIRYVALLPAHVCMNEVVISPTWNRMFRAVLDRE
ncbi:SDR family oxidoreductase [Lichenicola sp.]|uniref:SDR family oxidoreductase n=1 Tax=Lichenicola sp. TaxID=2804529 RepID=UPI003AFFB756